MTKPKTRRSRRQRRHTERLEYLKHNPKPKRNSGGGYYDPELKVYIRTRMNYPYGRRDISVSSDRWK